jgi:hypothetical protein
MGAKSFRARKRLEPNNPVLNDSSDPSPEALRIIDRALRDVTGRRLVSAAEVVDLLLDLRSAILLEASLEGLLDEVEVDVH